MIDSCSKRWQSNLELVAVSKGSQFGRINLKHPFINRDSILLEGSHVTTEAGIACVHTAPAHGF